MLFAYEWVAGAQPIWLPLYYACGGDLGPGWHVLRGAPVRIDLTQLTEATGCEPDTDEAFHELMAEWAWG